MTTVFDEAFFGATKRVRSVPSRARGGHADPAADFVGGAPYGTTKRGAESGAAACGPCRWGLRWSSLWA
eukprot:9085670-Pyramimonas_sp.AAC.1